jgi:hypothetical protein
MANHNHNRVLGRMGARELTQQELAAVTGGQAHTDLCTVGSNGQPDGDAHPCP